jgi:hypothetical protein
MTIVAYQAALLTDGSACRDKHAIVLIWRKDSVILVPNNALVLILVF